MGKGIKIGIVLLGVLGAFLHGMHLHTGYEEETKLLIAGNLYYLALILLTGAVFLFAYLQIRAMKKNQGSSFEDIFSTNSNLHYIIEMVCGIGIMGIGAVMAGQYLVKMLASNISLSELLLYVSTFVFWVLAILTGYSFLSLAILQKHKKAKGYLSAFPLQKQDKKESKAYVATFPLFFICMALIFVFRQNAKDPVISHYVINILFIIALMYAFYTMISFLFNSKGSPGKFIAYAESAIFLIITNIGGNLFAYFLDENNICWQGEEMIQQLAFLACALFVFVNFLIATKNIGKQNRLRKQQELEDLHKYKGATKYDQ